MHVLRIVDRAFDRPHPLYSVTRAENGRVKGFFAPIALRGDRRLTLAIVAGATYLIRDVRGTDSYDVALVSSTLSDNQIAEMKVEALSHVAFEGFEFSNVDAETRKHSLASDDWELF